MTEEMDFRVAYLEIALMVASRFPDCSITTIDLVRMLIFENDTLRVALKLPLPLQVLTAIDVDGDEF